MIRKLAIDTFLNTDVDGSKELEREEVSILLKKMQVTCDPTVFNKIFNKYDVD